MPFIVSMDKLVVALLLLPLEEVVAFLTLCVVPGPLIFLALELDSDGKLSTDATSGMETLLVVVDADFCNGDRSDRLVPVDGDDFRILAANSCAAV